MIAARGGDIDVVGFYDGGSRAYVCVCVCVCA